LAPDYTIVGRVVEGLEVIESVAAAGNLNNARDGAPKQNIGIVSAEFLSKKP
jgi:cyclophilin family peptidyl-prolyl cis-trans isomerase